MFPRRALILSSLMLLLVTAQEVCYASPLFLLMVTEELRITYFSARIKQQSELNVCRQATEFTCGPAALASLMTFYYHDPTTEVDIMRMSHTLERRTTSLTGLSEACTAKGYQATGYRMSLQELLQQVEKDGVPVLVHFETPTHHFSLVEGQVGDYILMNDPGCGQTTILKDDFMRRWSGKALVVKSSRPADREMLHTRKKSAELRLDSLKKSLQSLTPFHM